MPSIMSTSFFERGRFCRVSCPGSADTQAARRRPAG